MLTLYYPTKHIIGSNVDGEEKMTLLSSYKDWLTSLYKTNQKAFAAKRAHMKDILLKGIVTELGPLITEQNCSTEVSYNIVYYIGGYLVYSFGRKRNQCGCCLQSMSAESGSSLPENMTAQTLTKLKSKGWLKWASVELFNLLTIVEKTIICFVNEGLIFVRDAFEAILKELTYENLPPVGCHAHRIQFITDIIFKFMLLRFKCIAKRKSMEKTERLNSTAHTHAKLSKK